jgi:putative transposase
MYFITCCLYGRRRLLARPRVAELLLGLYAGARDRGKIALHAYVVMPDHYHLLLTLASETSISGLVRSVHAAFSLRCRDRTRLEGRLWQRRFYDHVIRDDRDWQDCWRYIHANPVTAALVSDPLDYVWSSCRFWEAGEGPIRCDAPR